MCFICYWVIIISRLMCDDWCLVNWLLPSDQWLDDRRPVTRWPVTDAWWLNVLCLVITEWLVTGCPLPGWLAKNCPVPGWPVTGWPVNGGLTLQMHSAWWVLPWQYSPVGWFSHQLYCQQINLKWQPVISSCSVSSLSSWIFLQHTYDVCLQESKFLQTKYYTQSKSITWNKKNILNNCDDYPSALLYVHNRREQSSWKVAKIHDMDKAINNNKKSKNDLHKIITSWVEGMIEDHNESKD